MVDVMAPVFENAEEEGTRRTRLRRVRSRKQSPRGTLTEAEPRREPVRRRHRARNDRGRRDEDESDSGSGESDSEDEGGSVRGQKAKTTVTTATRTPTLTSSVRTTTPTSAVAAAPTVLLTSSSRTAQATSTTPSSLPPVSTLAPLPTVSDPAVVANPQQSVPDLTVVPSGTPTSTVAGSADLPAFTLSSNPRKGEDSGLTSLASSILATASSAATGTAQSSPAAAFDAIPSPSIFIDDSGDIGDGNRDHDDHHNGGPPGGLSPTAEDVLISAGSIGAFILVCFVVWIGWRTLKKSKQDTAGSQYGDSSPQNNLLAKIPYFGRNWQDMNGPGNQSQMYDTKSIYSHSSTYSANDPRHVSQTMSSRGMPMTLPELQTNFTYSVNGHPFSTSTINPMVQPTSAQSMHSLASMQNALRISQGQQQQQVVQLPQLQTNFSPTMMGNNNPFASPQDGSNPPTLSPQTAVQYSNGTIGSGTMGNGTIGNGTMETFESLSSDRSRMPDAYFNQSELARQASTAYDPKQRAVYRASELSSISSGFGDGDFIIPAPPAALQPGRESRPMSYAKSVSRSRSNSNVNGHGQRDTVYTTTSEDMPARYRSVNSWVNQQTGRVQRQQERDDDSDVPPVPSLPAEDRYTMMMDDGEVPRRYEDTLSSQPPVPTVPSRSQSNPFDDPAPRK